MDILLTKFQEAHLSGSGQLLSSTLVPEAPLNDPCRLRRLSHSSHHVSIQADLRSGLLGHTNTEVRLSKAEGNAWVEVYAAYWKTIGEIVAISEGKRSNWGVVYDQWKDVANALVRGYSGTLFAAWTMPCIYVIARYLRIFAIKADEGGGGPNALTFDDSIQEDIFSDQNVKLEDAARVLNRIFTICISDRSV